MISSLLDPNSPKSANVIVVLKRLLYRQEVGELTVEELLQLALVEFVFVSIVSGVVVENCDQRIHRTLELARHSAAGRRDSSWKVKKNPSHLSRGTKDLSKR